MPTAREKVLVAMSGGVDSSVAAYLLKIDGYEVIGASMHLVSCHRPTERSCCSAADRLDAKRVCETLGVVHYSFDYRERFRRDVIDPFVRDYLAGRTPIPCVRCNSELKFRALFDDMKELACTKVATGHYARVEKTTDGSYRLLRGKDEAKDQSYYLFALTQTELAQLLLPVGELTKPQVRAIALRENLVTAAKPDSQEICFVTNDDYVSFIEAEVADKLPSEGNFVNTAGQVLGRHRGIHAYTVGQRRGLGIAVGKPLYVVAIHPHTNEVVLGSDDDVLTDEMTVGDMSWVHERFAESCHKSEVEVQIRASHTASPAAFFLESQGSARIKFHHPQRAVTPGQVAAFYHGDEMLGGGWIQ